MVLDFVSAHALRKKPMMPKRRADQIAELLGIVKTAATPEIRQKASLDLIALDPYGNFATTYVDELNQTVTYYRLRSENQTLDDLSRQRALQALRAAEQELHTIWMLRSNDPA